MVGARSQIEWVEQTDDLDSLDIIPYFANVEYMDLDFLGGEGRSNVFEGTNTASSNVCNASSSFLCEARKDWCTFHLSQVADKPS